MKIYRISLSFILFIAFLSVSCSTTDNTKTGPPVTDNSKYAVVVKNLSDHLNGIPRLSVSGNQVYNTSVSTFESSRSPLFVLDEVQLGRDLEQVLRMLDRNQVVIVQFIKMTPATVRYGEAGRNGVVIISRTLESDFRTNNRLH